MHRIWQAGGNRGTDRRGRVEMEKKTEKKERRNEKPDLREEKIREIIRKDFRDDELKIRITYL